MRVKLLAPQANRNPRMSNPLLTTMERYANALKSSDLSVSSRGFGDADILLAAGYASRQDDRGRQALMLNRMLYSGDHGRLLVMVEYCARWVKGQMYRPGPDRLPKMDHATVKDVCALVLSHWLTGQCPHCKGRGHRLIFKGAQVTEAGPCPHCDGTGRTDLDRLAGEHWKAARWLASELDRLIEKVERDMRSALSRREVA